jgi:formamidopyrimidine-DNA glycosylase
MCHLLIRAGKVFYLELDGEGKHPVLHFGMTGMLQVKGDYAAHYRKKPKNATIDWPPRFMKVGRNLPITF